MSVQRACPTSAGVESTCFRRALTLLKREAARFRATPADLQERRLSREEQEGAYQGIFEKLSDGLILNDLETGLVVEANPAASTLHGYKREDFVGLHPTDYVDPDSFPQFAGWVQAVRQGNDFAATAGHRRRDGTLFRVEVRGTGCVYRERLCLLSAVRDISERSEAERLLRQQLQARAREQSTLMEISQTLAAALELKPGLILDQLRVIVDYTYAVLFGLEERDLVTLAVRGPQELEEAMPARIPLNGPASLAALLNGHQPQRIADVRSADPAAQFLRSLLQEQAHVLLEGVQSWMWLPLAVKGQIIGGMGIAHAQADAFTRHQGNLALTMANQAAITLVNAQLYEQAQTVATLQERQRLAQNLHDAVNQSLFSASLIAEVLPRLLERNPEEAQEALEDLRRLTRGAMAEMRSLLAELRPLVLTDSDLGELLRQLGEALTGRTNVPVAVTVRGEGSLPAEVQVALYRVCQEALNNIAKHAMASEVTIGLEYQAGEASIHIRDNGRGFDAAYLPSGRQGLSIMRERARAMGAELSVASEPGHGTEIFVRWLENRKQQV